MSRAGILLSCLVLLCTDGCALRSLGHVRAEKRSRERDARAAALAWLELIDAKNYSDAYDIEPERLRAVTTRGQFIRSMRGRRAPFGRPLSRHFIGAAFTHKLTGAPDGRYESILLRTVFEQKKVAAERMILVWESGHWRVLEYRVY